MDRINFLIQVYILLVLQIIFTITFIYTLRDHQIMPRSILVYFVLALILLIILIMVNMPFWLKVVLFILFTFLISAMLYSLTFNLDIVRNALIGAILVFVVMTVVAKMGYNLSGMRVYLSVALIMLIIGYMLASLTPESSFLEKIAIMVGLVIFSMFVVYDTNFFLNKNMKLNILDAAISFYYQKLLLSSYTLNNVKNTI